MSPSDPAPKPDADEDEAPPSTPSPEPDDSASDESDGPDGPDEPDEPDADEDDEEPDRKPAATPTVRDRAGGARSPAKPAPPAAPSRRAFLRGLAAGIVLGAGGGFGAGYWLYRRRRVRRPRPELKPAHVPLRPHSPRKGPSPAKVTIVEFSEFECPFCGRAQPTLEQLMDKYPNDVALVFRHRPLPFHKQARGAALAMQAAARQGKAWELHDLMFENRKELERPALEGYAAKIGLDVERFKGDLDDPTLAAEVKLDEVDAEAAGASGTPTFFINGRPLRGARPLEDFVEVVDEEIKRADELIAAGTPLAELYDKRAKELVDKAGGPGQGAAKR